ncbi:unnamed protein product [Menidia menidia]|uniref:(Atlantic silverside) hypothetical protein n=1 Tax=Menidia menidia TaxID=238744 RepID=A0A8S4BEZ3_9TELE|nr:unnamed protein product [Menidia menidia]
MFGPEDVDFTSQSWIWPISSSEDTDRQGVIGEYSDWQESFLLHPNMKALPSRHHETVTEDSVLKESMQTKWPSLGSKLQQSVQEKTFNYQSTEKSSVTIVYPTQTRESKPTLATTHKPGKGWISTLLAGLGANPQHPTPTASQSNWGRTTGITMSTHGKQDRLIDIAGHDLHTGTASTEASSDDPRKDNLHVSKAGGTVTVGSNEDTTTIPCKTSDQSWTVTYPYEFTPSESLHPPLGLSPALLVPLYSDWNSAHATWGFAWEAHIYGLGSVFTLFGFISMVCLLGLPLRCPPGSLYLTMLHFFIMAFTGIQAFCLLYDAYSSQDRLPTLITLLLFELPLPCLISGFSLAFLLLSLRSRRHLSLSFAISASFSALPKPCILLCMSLLHFVVSLGCVGLHYLFNSLPIVILLLPQVVFVCLTIFLSCSYLIFFIFTQVSTKHVYRLNDNGESEGSPEVIRVTVCPFSKVEDWNRAARTGIGTALSLLGCGGLQLYGILHALGFGGVDGYGFMAWPWWGYQVGCRLCEIGVCLGLSIIGTHPLFSHKHSSIKTITHPRPGSWSRLSCNSPLRELTLPSQNGADSPVLSSHESFSQSKQEKLVVCDVVTKRQSETLPLCSMVDPSKNELDCVPNHNQTQSLLPLPITPSEPCKPENIVKPQQSSLDSLGVESDSTGDLRPPSPIDLSRSIDQALFSESLFSHSIFGLPRLHHASSTVSLHSPAQGASKQISCSVVDTLYRTSSCGNVDRDNTLSNSKAFQPQGSLTSPSNPPMPPEQLDWKGSHTGSTQGLCSQPKEMGKMRSHSWANRGQHFAHSSLSRGIPHLSYQRRYRTLSLASQDSHGSGRLAGTKQLSDSKQLEWDLAVQAEFVHVCRQIDALSVCSDTIEL